MVVSSQTNIVKETVGEKNKYKKLLKTKMVIFYFFLNKYAESFSIVSSAILQSGL
jgi:hypothetical protein